jgi:hypothetical protein
VQTAAVPQIIAAAPQSWLPLADARDLVDVAGFEPLPQPAPNGESESERGTWGDERLSGRR